MNKLILLTEAKLSSLLNPRTNESKFGEHVQTLQDTDNIYDSLLNLDVSYVIFGIKEDIGVFANYGNTGTARAWNATLKVLLNIQSNASTHAKKVLILGHLDFSEENDKLKSYDKSNKKDIAKARKKVSKIDKYVTSLVQNIIRAGKVPIVVGGGHNNAYGNIKGASLALKKPINVINFDAHCDFRAEEGRHSGNGFSYAYMEGFLKKYFIFGLHENYTSEHLFKTLNKLRAIKYNTFESISIRNESTFIDEMKQALEFVAGDAYGIEIDCDAVKNIPSSAMTPSGYSSEEARQFVNFVANHRKATYLSICEAAPTPESDKAVGKFITYLITDFIRAHQQSYEK